MDLDTSWCKKQMDDFIKNQKNVERKCRRKALYAACGVIVALILLRMSIGVHNNYCAEKKEYDSLYALEVDALQSKDYERVNSLFLEIADANYFYVSTDEAREQWKIARDTIFTQMMSKIEDLYKTKGYMYAYMCIDSLLPGRFVNKLDDEPKARFISQKADLQMEIMHHKDALTDSILYQIYQSNGKMSEETKAETDAVLDVCANDYWLNIIKSRGNE
jgi:hypothetical protein